MLQIQNLTIIQKKDDWVLVQDLSFVLNNGEKAALIGEEGNGKSTVLRWIAKDPAIEEYAEIRGTISCDNVTGYLSQELNREDGKLPVYAYLENTCGIGSKNPKTVSGILNQLGIGEDLIWEDRPVNSLSGGERIKLQILALLLNGCDLLLLDEPSNDLDLETLEWLESFLNRTSASVLYVSHDETLLERTAGMLIHIESVRRKQIPRVTVARVPYRRYMAERERRLDHQTQMAVYEHKEFQKKKDRYLSIYQAVDHAQKAVSRSDPSGGRLLKKKMHSVQSLGKRLEKEKESLTRLPETEWAILPKFAETEVIKNGKTVLDLFLPELTAGEKRLSKNVRLHITGPERVCIIGKNGCGKTTLIKEIARMLLGRTDIRAGYIPQNYDDLLDLTETPVMILAPSREKDAVTLARTYLASMKYTASEMDHPASELSGGQRAKILLLKLILEKNNVLILDEPTRNFSPLSNPALRKLFASFPGCVIAVTHDRLFLKEVATRVVQLTEDGLKPVHMDTDTPVCI